MLALVSAKIDGSSACDNSRASWLNDDRSLKLRHNFALFLCKDRIWDKHIVVQALTNTDLCSSLILHSTDGEGQSGEALVNLDEESASALHLEIVHLLELTLEDSAARLVLARFTLAGRNVNVKADNITRYEGVLSNLLSTNCAVDDHIVTINDVTLDLVREDTLDSVALELLSDLLDDLSHASVSGSLSDSTLSGLEGIPSSEDDISLAAGNWTIANNNCSCSIR